VCGEESLPLPEIEPRLSGSPACSQVTILTELTRHTLNIGCRLKLISEVKSFDTQSTGFFHVSLRWLRGRGTRVEEIEMRGSGVRERGGSRCGAVCSGHSVVRRAKCPVLW
jgi:hypothetical protein